MKHSDFDIDLRYGEMVENELLSALQGTFEVKAERGAWQRTGNIAVEFECRGKPSGIAVTQAKHWAHVFMKDDMPFCYLLFPVDQLKEIARKYYKTNTISGGDDKASKMVLIPIDEIFKRVKP